MIDPAESDLTPPNLPQEPGAQKRLIEAVLFASPQPMNFNELARRLPKDADLQAILTEIEGDYRPRGVNLVRRGDGWAFRTAADMASFLVVEVAKPRKLTRASVETLAIIAYHQPVTRAEIETIRGVAVSKGTLDVLLEAGWIKPGRRREAPGRPVTWISTSLFLDYFGLTTLQDLPGIEELRAAGLLDARPAITALADQMGLLDSLEDDVEPDEPLVIEPEEEPQADLFEAEKI